MYLPYLHGKQEELLAVATLAPALGDLVVPIIKPVNLDATNTIRRLERISDHLRVALITNSDKGRGGPPSYADVLAALSQGPLAAHPDRYLPAFELRATSTLPELARFATDFANRRCLIVHKRHTFTPVQVAGPLQRLRAQPVQVFVEPGIAIGGYTNLPSVARIVVRNGFIACERNADYPAQDAFDDLVYGYAARGFDGFGDFSMIGDSYSATGGPAHAVALHLTEDTGTDLVMNHFKSHSIGVDTRTMYLSLIHI